jgi:putative hemolysin
MHAGYAQTPAKFSIKGAVSESSNFHGVIMWTIVDGNKGTIFLQSPVGRGIVHVSLSPSTTCDSSTPICLFSTVIDTTDSKAFKVGDTARFSINLDSKQESVSLLSGTLAGFDVTVSLSKTWIKNTVPSATTAPVNSTTIANPASVYCTNHGGKLDIRTTPQGQTGVYVFSNGSECDEWGYFRGECSPSSAGTNSTTNSTAPRHLTVELNETVGIKAKS